jgi:hypothetical protein
MHVKYIPVVLLLLTSCQGTQSRDPASLSFRIPEGSTLTLNRQLEIPAGNTHALLQSGRPISAGDNDLYEISCRFDTRSFGPRTIEPEAFSIRRTEDGSRRASDGGLWVYYTELHLDSSKGTDVNMLRCQRWGYNLHGHFTVAEMETALGDYFTFTFPEPAPGRPGY